MTLQRWTADVVDGRRQRVEQAVKYALVGATGVAVDMGAFFVADPLVHYLAASGVAWLTAATWNFALDWAWTFERPAGSIARMYLAYLLAQTVAAAVRLATVVGVVEIVTAPPIAGNAAGIATGAVVGFGLSVRHVFVA